MIGKWELLKEENVFSCIPFKVSKKTYKEPKKGSKFEAYILDVADWANIIGINENNEVLLIRQFRFGTDLIELEIPGGVIEKGEAPLKGAIRELKEETGYLTKSIIQIGCVDSNPAIMNNKCYTFLAKLGEKGDVNFDPNEDIESEFVTQDKIKDLLLNGKITNAYIVAAFNWYFLHLQK